MYRVVVLLQAPRARAHGTLMSMLLRSPMRTCAWNPHEHAPERFMDMLVGHPRACVRGVSMDMNRRVDAEEAE